MLHRISIKNYDSTELELFITELKKSKKYCLIFSDFLNQPLDWEPIIAYFQDRFNYIVIGSCYPENHQPSPLYHLINTCHYIFDYYSITSPNILASGELWKIPVMEGIIYKTPYESFVFFNPFWKQNIITYISHYPYYRILSTFFPYLFPYDDHFERYYFSLYKKTHKDDLLRLIDELITCVPIPHDEIDTPALLMFGTKNSIGEERLLKHFNNQEIFHICGASYRFEHEFTMIRNLRLEKFYHDRGILSDE